MRGAGVGTDVSAAPGADDLGFTFRSTRQGEVHISRGGRVVTTLRGAAAARFLSQVEGADPAVQQQRMARVTGNYKRGNEGGRRP